MRKWLLLISSVLNNQNVSIVEAVMFWKNNLEKHFEGLEACLICYSIINPSTKRMPNLKCKKCGIMFHNTCLFQWFKQSGKSQCPHCQTLWSL